MSKSFSIRFRLPYFEKTFAYRFVIKFNFYSIIINFKLIVYFLLQSFNYLAKFFVFKNEKHWFLCNFMRLFWKTILLLEV